MPRSILNNSLIHIAFMPGAADINQQILATYLQFDGGDFSRRSHFFGGRFENLYFERESIPAVKQVLEHANTCAAEILKVSRLSLRNGFWINDAGPEQSTTEHDHDDNDEILTGVYYIQVPPESGDLVIVDKHCRTLLSPQPGMFAFFAPNVLHSVSVNRSKERRISMGMNFGPSAN